MKELTMAYMIQTFLHGLIAFGGFSVDGMSFGEDYGSKLNEEMLKPIKI